MPDASSERKGGIPTPHDGQRKLLELKARCRVAVCGRRFGKTTVAAIAAVTKCVQQPGCRVWWISPVQEQSERVEREVWQWLSNAKVKMQNAKILSPPAPLSVGAGSAAWKHQRSAHALECGNGSRIEFHSAHVPDNLRGAGLDLAVVDEAADVSEYAWKNVIKPMLLDRRGEAYILGTPRGTNNWLHRVFLLGQDAANADACESRQLPTWENPRIARADVDEYRLEMSDDEFRQEFEAQFIDGVDSVFPNVGAAVRGAALERGRAGEVYITGIDLGDRHDFTALCSLACRAERVEGFARFNKIGWDEQKLRIAAHLEKFPGPCVVDVSGPGSPIFEDIRRPRRGVVVPFTFSAEKKEELVQGLIVAFSSGALKIPDIKELLGELQAFKRLDDGRGPSRFKTYGAPAGLHDDCVMALGLAWWGLKKAALWAAPASGTFARRGFFN